MSTDNEVKVDIHENEKAETSLQEHDNVRINIAQENKEREKMDELVTPPPKRTEIGEDVTTKHGSFEEIEEHVEEHVTALPHEDQGDNPTRIDELYKAACEKLYDAALNNDWKKAYEEVFKKDPVKNSEFLTAGITDDNDTALHVAIREAAAKSFKFAEQLIKYMKREDLAIKNKDDNTAFFLVAASGNVRLAKQMFEKNVELPNIRGKNEMLPIHKAAQHDRKPMVEFIYGIQRPLEEIDSKKLSEFNVNVSEIEIKWRNRHFELYWAALKGDWDTAERIYKEYYIDIRVKLSKDGRTALHIAAAGRHTGFVKKLLEKMNKEDLAVKDNAGNTAFFLAAASKRVEIVKAMMEKNEDIVNIRGDNDMLPLQRAALMGDGETVEYLYGATEDPMLDHDNDHIELLVSLIKTGLYDTALKLVKRHPELATERDKNWETALHSLARMPILRPVLDLSIPEILTRISIIG